MKLIHTLFVSILFISLAFGQKATLRGTIYDESNSTPIPFASVEIAETEFGAIADQDGIFTIADIPLGDYQVFASFIGYDSVSIKLKLNKGINYHNFYLKEGLQLGAVEISAANTRARTDVQVSRIYITPKEIKSLPSTGGDGDIAQFLTIIPGIVSTGDQGGQLYIRGGAPVQNKILLDGITIFNPFHSIGLFSVFETEAVRTAEVISGGFDAAYSGRISAVVDIKTREGNRKEYAGLVSLNPFQARAMFEGPIKKPSGDKLSTTSFLLSAKRGIIDQTSTKIGVYKNINDSIGLPYNYTDLFGKFSVVSESGSKFNFIGFNFTDGVKFGDISNLHWQNSGGGMNFNILTPGSNFIMGGLVSYSKYNITLEEKERDPRTSSISPYNLQLDFTYFGNKTEVKYGIEINGFRTAFEFKNNLGFTINQFDNNTEIGGFLKWKYKSKKFVFEPSVRMQYFASLSTFRLEPRLGMKYNLTDKIRLKFAGGIYNQNLISTVNERDIVNLFVGFLSGPSEKIYQSNSNIATKNKLQTANHIVAGIELDLIKYSSLNIEVYNKSFTQLINLNRNKTESNDPNYIVETGNARGIDFLFKYSRKSYYLWAGYSYAFVDRDNGDQVYPTIFDRRHNLNLLASWAFDKKQTWELSTRFNFGSGFPFTQARGFFNQFAFNEGLNTNPIVENQQIGVLYSEKINGGRLPDFARFDASLKKTIEFNKKQRLEANVSFTNILNRENIFYFDRIKYTRINQLPFIPSIGLTFFF